MGRRNQFRCPPKRAQGEMGMGGLREKREQEGEGSPWVGVLNVHKSLDELEKPSIQHCKGLAESLRRRWPHGKQGLESLEERPKDLPSKRDQESCADEGRFGGGSLHRVHMRRTGTARMEGGTGEGRRVGGGPRRGPGDEGALPA